MEKKGNRNLPLAKASTTDSKKDGSISSRAWPRGSRRREIAGSSLSNKAEVCRKPQRVNTLDKRPRARGGGGSQYSGSGSLAGSETSWIDQGQHVELGSVFLPGSKKQSLNHLLNFSYTPRERENYRSDRGHHGYNGNRKITTKKHTYNKEHFLQANCQFIVNDTGEYKQYLNNPDALVDWNLVEQVNVQVWEFPSCPICLYPPVAAKMTRCGHIYCWSCILHYLSLSDKPSRKCPICFDNIQNKDLKSVVAIPHSTFNTAETITFKLMKRPKGSMIAYPAAAGITIKEDNCMFNVTEEGSKEIYSKLLLADKSNVLSIIEREHGELHSQLQGDDDTPEKCFIEEAMALLKERKDALLDGVCNIETCHYPKNLKLGDEIPIIEKAIAEIDIDEDDTITMDNEDQLEMGANQSSKFYYFYQALDGQHIYLHAINAKMLEHTYGSLEFAPKTLTGKILEKEGGSMTEALRKRLRYLQHLPVTCQFEIAEIQLKSPDVNKDTLDHFHEQLEIRRKRRQKRAKEEKRREKRIELEENRKLQKYPHPNLHLESNIQFPEFGFESRLRSESESTVPSEESGSPSYAYDTLLATSPSTSHQLTYSAPSFAKMLANEKKSVPWPSLKPSASCLSESRKLINVTGAMMKVETVRTPSDTEPDPEDYEPVQSYNRSFGDAIAQALQKAKENETSQKTSGKKKKSKKKLLFATNMAYSGK